MNIARPFRFLALAALVACGPGAGGDDGDDDGDDDSTTPRLIAGGGVASAAIDGTLNVHVVAAGGATPVVGASVRVGAASAATPLTGTTSATGLVVFTDPALTGPQTVTVTAPGHAAATWVGVAGTNVTIPLDPLPRTTPSARVSGTIAGWNDLPAPAFGHYTLAVVLATFTDDVGAPENNLPQAMSGTTPLNTCVRSSSAASTCAWELVARIGRQRHVAVIVNGDSRLTPNDTGDDVYTLVGYAASAGVTLTAGQQVTGESLTLVAAGARSQFSVSFPPALPGLGDVVAIPMLDLGDDGRVVFPLPTVAPGQLSTQVLTPTGGFAGSYRVVALASAPGTAATPYSSVFMDVVALGSAVAIDPWLPAPAAITRTGGQYTFTGATGAAIHYASFSRADGTTVWTLSLLDGSTGFALPALTPDPLGTGGLTLTVSAADVTGFDPRDFEVRALAGSLHRASGAAATVR